MINIKFKDRLFFVKIILFIVISLLIFFISSSKIVFPKEFNKNIKSFNLPEEELAIKYCDATNKNIFNGLDRETLLKYEYYFSSLKKPFNKNPDILFKEFSLNVMKKCSYKLTDIENQEFKYYIKKFLKPNN